MIKAIVFDLDDTLISEREYIRSGFKVVSEKIGKEYKLDINHVNELMHNLFNESSKNVFNRVLDKLNIQYDLNYIKELINTYREHMPDIRLYDDAKEILEYLYSADLKLGIITDGHKITQRNKLKVLDIEKNFECIVVTDELGREYWKPHRKSYDLVKETLGVEFNEMVYIGDNVSKDFVTANKLGINTILINREHGIYSSIYKEDEYNAKNEINNLNEILELLNINKVLGDEY